MAFSINTNLSEAAVQRWQILKESVKSFTQSAHQFGQSLKETAAQRTDSVIDTVTTTLEQTKGSLEHNWQTVKQIKNTTSGAIETAITTSLADFITQHPAFLRILQIFGWVVNHPIISLVIFLFVIALTGNIFKGIIRLIETVSWSILKVPCQLIQAVVKAIFISLTKFGNRNWQKITGTKKNDYISAITPVNTTIYQDKQQRLAAIYHRLEVIQKEQQQLLQEGADIIGSETTDMIISNIKLNNIIGNANEQEKSS